MAAAALAAAVLILCVRLLLLHRAMDELRAQLPELLGEDTNVLLGISSRDKHARALAAALNRELRELRRLRGRLPGAKILLADCGMTADARALASYLADREQGVALADGAVIDLGEHNHTKEEAHGRAGHL